VAIQAYPAQADLTGRYSQFHALRKQGGVAGFNLKRAESPLSTMSCWSSSTALAALGALVSGP